MKHIKKNRIGMTLLDLILVVLVAAAVLSTVFYDQIRSFLKEEEIARISYTFLVENVTDSAVNLPSKGEVLYEKETQSPLGTLTDLSETQRTYDNDAGESTVVLSTLTCKAQAEAIRENGALYVSGLKVKKGVSYTLTTDTASFKMIIIAVETVDE
ncbi:MAG: DUF4330 family protein [Clostridia bacterium]|nr:DUF4330 family protein [Clostridia bacterium]